MKSVSVVLLCVFASLVGAAEQSSFFRSRHRPVEDGQSYSSSYSSSSSSSSSSINGQEVTPHGTGYFNPETGMTYTYSYSYNSEDGPQHSYSSNKEMTSEEEEYMKELMANLDQEIRHRQAEFKHKYGDMIPVNAMTRHSMIMQGLNDDMSSLRQRLDEMVTKTEEETHRTHLFHPEPDVEIFDPGFRKAIHTTKTDYIHLPRTMVFPEEEQKEKTVQEPTRNDEIPISMFMMLSNVTSQNQLFSMINKAPKMSIEELIIPEVSQYLNQGIGGEGITGRTNSAGHVQQAEPANCEPEPQVAELDLPKDPTLVFWPTCVRIKRCGGCCSHSLLTCRPTRTRSVLMQVVKTVYTGSNTLEFGGMHTVQVEEHLSCQCGCKIQESDCNVNQEYKPHECRCECTNIHDKQDCQKQQGKFWDPSDCSCKCRTEEPCSTGTYFDQNTCRCQITGPKVRDIVISIPRPGKKRRDAFPLAFRPRAKSARFDVDQEQLEETDELSNFKTRVQLKKWKEDKKADIH